MPMAFFVDTTRCTACRGCQIACKEWNGLPANQTKQRGSHQNPPDLNPNNYKIVRFSEHRQGENTQWLFFPDQCRHCVDPPCVHAAAEHADNAMIRDEQTGAILYSEHTQKISDQGFEEIREACPYNIPRRDEKSGKIVKCTMCHERVTRGLLPMCVKSCPTGAMNFGERGKMFELAKRRLEELKKAYPKAVLADPDDVSVIYLLQDEPAKYHQFAVAQNDAGFDRKRFLVRLASPWRRVARAAGI